MELIEKNKNQNLFKFQCLNLKKIGIIIELDKRILIFLLSLKKFFKGIKAIKFELNFLEI